MHLYAPAGAGKTFLALHCILLALFDANGNASDNMILFVVKNESLALFVVKWLCARCEGAVKRRKMLTRLHLLFQPYGDGPRVVTLVNGRLETMAAPCGVVYVMIAVDEAHHVFSDPSVRKEVDKYTAPLLASSKVDKDAAPLLASAAGSPSAGYPRFLILSDLSQTADIDKAKFPDGLYEVFLTEVVRSSQRILAGASAFQLNAAHGEETESQHQADGPPLKSVIFELPGGSLSHEMSHRVEHYVEKTVMAMQHHVAAMFPGLSFHDRVGIIVPDEKFRAAFCAALERKGLEARLQEQVAGFGLAGKGTQGLEELLQRRFRVVDAAEASRSVPEQNARVEAEMIVVRTRLQHERH